MYTESSKAKQVSIVIIVAIIFGILLYFSLSKKTPLKLYKLTFPTGTIIIDSLRDEKNVLINERATYPKDSLTSYKEVTRKQLSNQSK
jgi:hypothetical protein